MATRTGRGLASGYIICFKEFVDISTDNQREGLELQQAFSLPRRVRNLSTPKPPRQTRTQQYQVTKAVGGFGKASRITKRVRLRNPVGRERTALDRRVYRNERGVACLFAAALLASVVKWAPSFGATIGSLSRSSSLQHGAERHEVDLSGARETQRPRSRKAPGHSSSLD